MASADFNGQYSDIVTTYKHWTLYDWLVFADVIFVFVCKDLTFTGSLTENKKQFAPPRGVRKASSFTQVVHNLHMAIAFFVRV